MSTDKRDIKTVLADIQATMASDVEAMNGIIRDVLRTDYALVDSISENYLVTKGKQVRPILVMLAAKMFGEISEKVLYCAAALELLHNATLIHDDVLDQTELRRGRSTINSLWGNHVAVLSGDIFVSKALQTGVKSGSLEILRTLSELGTELSLGEINQLFNARNHSFDPADYYKMIERKTASLFMGCVRIGALAVGASEEQIKPLVDYAYRMGLAFQIRDDIFDYFPSADIGKPSGHDLLEGKVTLPLLYALNTAPESEVAPMKALLEDDHELTATDVKILQDFAISHGGIEAARDEMLALKEDGNQYLMQLPDNESRRSFEDIFSYIIERNY